MLPLMGRRRVTELGQKLACMSASACKEAQSAASCAGAADQVLHLTFTPVVHENHEGGQANGRQAGCSQSGRRLGSLRQGIKQTHPDAVMSQSLSGCTAHLQLHAQLNIKLLLCLSAERRCAAWWSAFTLPQILSACLPTAPFCS
jgi:hypothetical protein